jgi:hypothetical protein
MFDATKIETGKLHKEIICFFIGHGPWDWWQENDKIVKKQCLSCGAIFANIAPHNQYYFRKGDPKPFTIKRCPKCKKDVPVIEYEYSMCGQGDWGRHSFCFICGSDVDYVPYH